MKNVRLVLLIFSALLIAGAVLLIIWANMPPSVTTHISKLHLIAPSKWGEQTINQIVGKTFILGLTYPEVLKTGQTGHCEVEIEQLPAAIEMEGVEYHIRVRSELILPGFINQQEGMFTQSVQDQKPVRFTWNVRALKPREITGTLRLFVDYISPDNTIYNQLLSVVELRLTSVSLSGLSTTGATSLAVALVLLAGLAGGLGISRPRYE